MATSGSAPQEAALRIVGAADDEAARTYVFRGEEHTLGNSLRHVLMRHKDAEFCGYSVPHPSEPFVHVRLQTTGAPAKDVLDDGLKQLSEICDALTAKLDTAEGLAEARKRSDSVGTAFPGPGRALENARRRANPFPGGMPRLE